MKLKEIEADIFSFSGPRIICHGVNMQRKMNSGIAKTIREKWPVVYMDYFNNLNNILGGVQFVEVEPQVYVANCYTQEYYGYDNKKYASYWAVVRSMEQVLLVGQQKAIPVYMPLIGCGLGGLEWPKLRILIQEMIDQYDYDKTSLTVCLPPAGIGHIGQKASIL